MIANRLIPGLAAIAAFILIGLSATETFAQSRVSQSGPDRVSRQSTALLSQTKRAMSRLPTKLTPRSRAAIKKLTPSQRRQVSAIGKLVSAGKIGAARQNMQRLIKGMPKRQAKSLDIQGLVQAVIRASYLEQTASLRAHAKKVKYFNEQKRNVRDAANAARDARRKESQQRKLATTGEDAQLANIDLQNALQKQQQALQTMSNVSKMLHDTAMAVIRKIG